LELILVQVLIKFGNSSSQQPVMAPSLLTAGNELLEEEGEEEKSGTWRKKS
jgi:hypothetical protein